MWIIIITMWITEHWTGTGTGTKPCYCYVLSIFLYRFCTAIQTKKKIREETATTSVCRSIFIIWRAWNVLKSLWPTTTACAIFQTSRYSKWLELVSMCLTGKYFSSFIFFLLFSNVFPNVESRIGWNWCWCVSVTVTVVPCEFEMETVPKMKQITDAKKRRRNINKAKDNKR